MLTFESETELAKASLKSPQYVQTMGRVELADSRGSVFLVLTENPSNGWDTSTRNIDLANGNVAVWIEDLGFANELESKLVKNNQNNTYSAGTTQTFGNIKTTDIDASGIKASDIDASGTCHFPRTTKVGSNTNLVDANGRITASLLPASSDFTVSKTYPTQRIRMYQQYSNGSFNPTAAVDVQQASTVTTAYIGDDWYSVKTGLVIDVQGELSGSDSYFVRYDHNVGSNFIFGSRNLNIFPTYGVNRSTDDKMTWGETITSNYSPTGNTHYFYVDFSGASDIDYLTFYCSSN